LPEEKIHSIYPVCDGSIDNIKGIVSLKDIFKAKPGTVSERCSFPGFYVPKIIQLTSCLKDLKN
jgi:putative hemolysin